MTDLCNQLSVVVVLQELKTAINRIPENSKQMVLIEILFFIPKLISLFIVTFFPFNSYPAKFLIVICSEN